MKKLIFLTIAIMLLFSLRCHAATLYVRQGGADYPTCDGSTNVDYADRAEGTDNCALSHPAWLTGAGNGSSFTSGRMAANDVGVVGPGSYLVGYTMPNTGGYCTASNTGSCALKAPPSGTGGNYTKLIGCSTTGCASEQDRPELYLVGATWGMVDVSSISYVEFSDLEITDHYNGYCYAGTPLQLCGKRAFFTSAIGATWHHLKFTNLNIHGLSESGMVMGSSSSVADVALTMTNIDIVGNRSDGFSGDSCGGLYVGEGRGTCGYNGNIVFTDCDISFNGCYENYPLTGVGDDMRDRSCKNAGPSSVNGDGVSMSETGGTWTFTNCNFSHKTSEGLDLLYHGSLKLAAYRTYTLGPITVKGGIYEGNGGNQIKANRMTKIYSALILGNCNYFYPGVNVDGSTTVDTLNICRSTGATITLSGAGTTGYYPELLNSTVTGNGVALIDSGFSVGAYNNILYGGAAFLEDPDYYPGKTQIYTSLYYTTAVSGDYNICYNFNSTPSWCSSGNNIVDNPDFTGSPPVGPVNYYWTPDFYEQVTLGATSPARDAADETAQSVYTVDVNQDPRGVSWDIGAYEYDSSAPAPTCDENCDYCSDETTCDASAIGCDWWESDSDCHSVVETCNNNCDLCAETQAACSASTKSCYWWESISQCEGIIEGCNDYCGDCMNETTCEASTLGTCEWKRSTGLCGTTAETCAEHYSRCLTEATCVAQSYYWYNGTCNATPAGWEQLVKWDTAATGSVANNSIVTVPVTVGNNEYRMLLVGLGWEPSTNPASVSSVTANAQACTLVDTQGFGASQVYSEDFEDQSYTELTETESSGTATIQDTNVYAGTYSSKHVASAGGSAYVKQTADLTGYNRATVYARFKIKLPADYSGVDSIDVFRFRDTYPATLSLLGIGSDGTFYVYNSPNATSYTTTYEVPLDQYVDVVYGTYVHDTAGWIKVWVDGVQILNQTAIDTRKTTTSAYVGQADLGIVVNDDADTEATLYIDNFELNTAVDRNEYVAMYYCLPDIGNMNIVATMNNSVSGLNMGVISIAGVNQAAPGSAKASGSGATASTAPTTTADSSWLIDVVGNIAGGDLVGATGQTERYFSSESMRIEGGTTPVQTAGETTSSWTVSSDYWGMITATVEPGEAVLPGEDTCDTVCTLCEDADTCGGSGVGCYWWSSSECKPTPETFITGCSFGGVKVQ